MDPGKQNNQEINALVAVKNSLPVVSPALSEFSKYALHTESNGKVHGLIQSYNLRCIRIQQ